jgi:hypothetical protein
MNPAFDAETTLHILSHIPYVLLGPVASHLDATEESLERHRTAGRAADLSEAGVELAEAAARLGSCLGPVAGGDLLQFDYSTTSPLRAKRVQAAYEGYRQLELVRQSVAFVTGCEDPGRAEEAVSQATQHARRCMQVLQELEAMPDFVR